MKRGTDGNVESPSPQEIKRRAAAIRAKWDARTEWTRCHHFPSGLRNGSKVATADDLDGARWQPPVVSIPGDSSALLPKPDA